MLIMLAAGLAGILGLEFAPRSRDEKVMQDNRTRATVVPPLAAPLPFGERSQKQVETILARPIFSPARRPPATAPAGAAVSGTALPRVTGILVNGRSRSVIFAAASGGRPLVVDEGADVNGYKVQSIENGQVTLLGPDGPRVLRPSFDPTPPPRQLGNGATPAGGPDAAGPPNLLGLNGRAGLPGQTNAR